MINKIYEIIENAPLGTDFIGAYDFSEYLYSKGVRYITPAYYIDDGIDWYCSHCNTHFNYADYRFCPHCGAQFLANILVDKNTIFKIYKDSAKEIIGKIGIYKWKKWKKKKFRMKAACSMR